MSLAETCEAEVREFHEFIEDWFVGRLPGTAAAYERARSALADDFELISPGGDVGAREAVLDGMRGAHGDFGDDFEISIRNVRARYETDDACLLVYEETQHDGEERTTRISTALFRRTADGVEWVHLHETWQ